MSGRQDGTSRVRTRAIVRAVALLALLGPGCSLDRRVEVCSACRDGSMQDAGDDAANPVDADVDGGPDGGTSGDGGADGGQDAFMPGPLLDYGGCTFARASAATWATSPGVVQSFASGARRLLVDGSYVTEGPTTNLLPSASPTSLGHNTHANIDPSRVEAPDGTASALRVDFMGNGDTWLTAATHPSGGRYAASAYVRGNGRVYLGLFSSGIGASRLARPITATSAWTRFDVTGSLSGMLDTLDVGPAGYSDPNLDAGVYELWGWQVETLPFPTSFVSPESAGASRAPDEMSCAVPAAMGSAPWSIVVASEAASTEISTGMAMTILETEGGQRLQLRNDGAGVVVVVSSGVASATLGPLTFARLESITISVDPRTGSVRASSASGSASGMVAGFVWGGANMSVGHAIGAPGTDHFFGVLSAPRP
ncbi:MAG: hypothetical protein U0234_00280 [Sandaracinus sp.]